MLIFEHSPPSCRGDIVTLFLYDSDIGFTSFHSPPIQKWLMRVIRQGVPATAFYFILTEKNAAEVERGAWMDVLRFSKPNGNCPANRQALVSLAFLASRNSKKAVRMFETLLKKRDIQTPTDDSLLFPAIALSGNRTLLEKLPDIIRTDERQRFNGLDAIPQSFSFAHEAAAACSMAIEGFPLIDHWESFTEEKRHMAIDWLSRHPDYTIKPDIRRIFTDSSLSVMIPDQAEALRAIGELSD